MITKQKSVLIIDDNLALLELMEHKLRKNKFFVFNANNGNDAISKYEQFSPEIILTDLHMPDMDGFEVAAHIKDIAQKRKESPIIFFITSEDSKEIINKIEKEGFEYIMKPVDFKLLFSKIS